jgi:hypothetical protein
MTELQLATRNALRSNIDTILHHDDWRRILSKIKNEYRCDTTQFGQTVNVIIDYPSTYRLYSQIPPHGVVFFYYLGGLVVSSEVTLIASYILYDSVVYADDPIELSMVMFAMSIIIIFTYLSYRTFIQAKAHYKANKKIRETIRSNLKEIRQIIRPWLQSTNNRLLTDW